MTRFLDRLIPYLITLTIVLMAMDAATGFIPSAAGGV
jgi:hypothetical protein